MTAGFQMFGDVLTSSLDRRFKFTRKILPNFYCKHQKSNYNNCWFN